MEITNTNIETKKTTDTNAPSLQTDLLNDDRGFTDIRLTEAERLREELDIERDLRLRLAAEYQNYRRRTEQEKARAADKGKSELLTELLSLADELDLALDRAKDSAETIVEGVQMIHRHFLDILDANGVTAFGSEGESFDPELHEAFDVVPAGKGKAGTVHREMRRGYLFNGKLLRPSLVVVKQ